MQSRYFKALIMSFPSGKNTLNQLTSVHNPHIAGAVRLDVLGPHHTPVVLTKHHIAHTSALQWWGRLDNCQKLTTLVNI